MRLSRTETQIVVILCGTLKKYFENLSEFFFRTNVIIRDDAQVAINA
jgi:hypothetical protein